MTQSPLSIDPNQVTVGNSSVGDSWKICVIEGVYFGENEYNGSLGARISSIFVIFALSAGATIFPMLSRSYPNLRIPVSAYLFTRYFGSGVILATAFVHLLDPAYGKIGPDTCVGMTGNWSKYSFVAGIVLATLYGVFLLDLVSSVYVERKYGIVHDHNDNTVKDLVTRQSVQRSQHDGSEDHPEDYEECDKSNAVKQMDSVNETGSVLSSDTLKSFQSQFAAFLILEFGIIFHSIMIGLNLGTTGDEFRNLYIVLVFHQTFEGLGIGARMSAIPFPQGKQWIPYVFALAYGLSTPVATAIGLGVRTTYMSSSYTANVVAGVLDAISAGILVYTALIELLARDFILNPRRTKNLPRLLYIVTCHLLGTGIMSLLGKWA
uniref:ARAD1D26290p n=1 Tax=Blastobotrys adeninivorans TaxID=409370 RepID=A0A060TB99_BLAAD